jgi:hypothetical protein
VHPAGQQAGLGDDGGGPLPGEQLAEFLAGGGQGVEAGAGGVGVVGAGDALALAQVEGENGGAAVGVLVVVVIVRAPVGVRGAGRPWYPSGYRGPHGLHGFCRLS